MEDGMRPVVVIGAGPQGLAAAAHLLERGLEPLVLEAGQGPAAAVAEWGHVRLFSSWPELIDDAGRRLLESTGWQAPEPGFPFGAQWISEYLAPLAGALQEHVRYGARVIGVGRKGRDRTVDAARDEQPFTVHLRYSNGREDRIEASSVIDASGTWASPSPIGADGIPALGEQAAHNAGILRHGVPRHDEARELAAQHVVVVGNGHSATTAIGVLADVVKRVPGSRVTWVLRRDSIGNTFGGGSADELTERGALGLRAQRAVDEGYVRLVTGFRTESVALNGDQVVLGAADGRRLDPADRVFALTGFRPDLSFLGELRLELDTRLQAPLRLAVEVDPNVHSCGSVRATGAADLAHPETGFFIVGAKSYGRAPTFLALTGYEQVRSVVAYLAGDLEAAERVDLVLPDTGVCGGSGLFDAPEDASGACCSSEPKAEPETVPV